MNQFYNLEEKPISSISNKNSVMKSQPSDMVIRNILNYSLALRVMKSKQVKKNSMQTVHLILN
ncbi:MAG: hypothetical protein GQ527_00840 [Bacteroidales bacterium]|nr:hypothetical protein [Bacteroidales bacterium]